MAAFRKTKRGRALRSDDALPRDPKTFKKRKTSERRKNGGQFEKGNKAAVGNPGPWAPRFLTLELVQQLQEIDDKTKRPQVAAIVRDIIRQAKKGVLAASFGIFDRVEGRPTQAITLSGQLDGEVTLVRRVIIDSDGREMKDITPAPTRQTAKSNGARRVIVDGNS